MPYTSHSPSISTVGHAEEVVAQVPVRVGDIRVAGAVEHAAVARMDHRLGRAAEGVVVPPDAGDRGDRARRQRVEPWRHVEKFAIGGAGGVAHGDEDVAVFVRRHLQPDLRIALRERRDGGAVERDARAGEVRAGDRDDRSAGNRPLRGQDRIDARLPGEGERNQERKHEISLAACELPRPPARSALPG